MRRRLGLMVAAAALAALPAAGQPMNKLAADAAFEEGKRLMGEGKHAEACPKLAESQRLDPASGTLLWLGECYEKVGKVASAWATFREASSMAASQGKPDREKQAKARAAALEPRVSRVSLVVESPAPEQVLKLDGVALGSALWGTALPIDPGAHSVEATAPGRLARSVSFNVAGDARSERVTIPALEVAPAAPVVAPTASAAPTASSRPPAPPQSAAPRPSATPSPQREPPPPRDAASAEAPSSSRKTVGWVLTGGGVVLAAIGAGLQASARSAAHDAVVAVDKTAWDAANERQTLAFTAMIGGGGAALVGVILLATAPSEGAKARLQAAPAVGQGFMGVNVGGQL